jgi:hypothetical protein
MKEPKKTEKRRAVRAQLTVPVIYRPYPGDPAGKRDAVTSHTNDISVNGLKLAVSQHHPVNTKLEMEIIFPKELGIFTPARVIGNVVGSGNWKSGGIVDRFDRIAFVDVDKNAQLLILRLVFEIMKRKAVKKD